MKYELSERERQQIENGEIFTYAAIHPDRAALCEYVATYNGIEFKFELSETPTGKSVFVFFFYPKTIYQAFQAGSMLERPELYSEEIEIAKWVEQFKVISGLKFC